MVNIVNDKRLATQILGAQVKNSDGENLGTIDDFLVDFGQASGALAIVAFGGFLGFDTKTYAIPVEALSTDPAGHFILAASAELIAKAPEFYPERFADYNDDATLNGLRDYYLRS